MKLTQSTISNSQTPDLDFTKFIVPDEKGNLFRVKYLEGNEREQYTKCIDEHEGGDKPLSEVDGLALFGVSLDAEAVAAAQKISANFVQVDQTGKAAFGYRIPRVPRYYDRTARPNLWNVASKPEQKFEKNNLNDKNQVKTIDLYRVGVVRNANLDSEESRQKHCAESVSLWTSFYHFDNLHFAQEASKAALNLDNMDALNQYIQQMPDRQTKTDDKQQGDDGMTM